MQGNEAQLVNEESSIPNLVLLPNAARNLTDDIKAGLSDVYELIKTAYHGQAWKALKYGSWDAYVTGEFGHLHLRPPREAQNEVVQSLRESGMSVRAIGSATQLGYGTVKRRVDDLEKAAKDLEGSGDPNGSPDPSRSRGLDGKTYVARRATPSAHRAETQTPATTGALEKSGRISVEDVLDLPADAAGIEPLDLAERADQGRERMARILRDFHGSGASALPMTIKLASQVAGFVSPVSGQSEVPSEEMHEVGHDATRTVRTLVFMLTRMGGALSAGDSLAAIVANLRDSRNDMDAILQELEGDR